MTTDIQKADRISRQRGRWMPMMAVLLLTQQGLFLSWDGRAVTIVQTIAWLVLALVLLLTLVTGGNWFMPRRVRELADDEVTRANRAKGVQAGFMASALVAMLVFVVAPFEPISAQRAAHLIVTIGLALGILVFGLAERKAND